jgi:acetyltransferase-like isoleucine patch superfamily enzyme/acyl carrier protein
MSVSGGWRVRWRLRDVNQVGRDVAVFGPLAVQNDGRIEIGDDVVLEASPVVSHLVTGPRGLLRIGNGVRIGHAASIASHAEIRIGAGTIIGAFVSLLDTDFHVVGAHDEDGGTTPIMIGEHVTIGPSVTVLRGSTIGDGAWIAPGSVVTGVVPAGARVGGVPARAIGDGNAEVVAVELDAVLTVVQRTFGMAERPASTLERSEIAAWDSLGHLNLLLSLEQTFGVLVNADALGRVAQVGDLVALLDAAPAAHATSTA